jgi:hypothetical protein
VVFADRILSAIMQQWDTIKLSWINDLVSPEVPGKCFSRHGFRVVVSPDDLNAARSALSRGAKDVLFTATRGDTLSGEAYYSLASYEIVG